MSKLEFILLFYFYLMIGIHNFEYIINNMIFILNNYYIFILCEVNCLFKKIIFLERYNPPQKSKNCFEIL